MAQLQLNLSAIQKARAALAQQRDAQRDAAVQLKDAQAALDAATRAGADPAQLAQQRANIAGLQQQGRAALADTASRIGALTKLSEQLRGRRDPSAMVAALDTAHPVMLLPVAIQTRYDDAASLLMIRIYPDAIRARWWPRSTLRIR